MAKHASLFLVAPNSHAVSVTRKSNALAPTHAEFIRAQRVSPFKKIATLYAFGRASSRPPEMK